MFPLFGWFRGRPGWSGTTPKSPKKVKHTLLLLQNQLFEKFPSRHGNPWKAHADMLFKAFGRFRESADQQPSHFAGNCVFASQSTGPRVGEGNQSRYDETETTKNRFRNPNNACSAMWWFAGSRDPPGVLKTMFFLRNNWCSRISSV